MTKTQKVIFFGTSDFATPALKSLINNNYNVVAVFTGKGPISTLAQEYGIKVFQPDSLKKDEQIFETFKLLRPDLCIIAAYGKIIPQKFLDIPRYGFLNIHPSLLPKYRGPSPIQTAILNGDKETGVTIMMVDAEIDHGPILAMQKLEFLISNFEFLKLQEELSKLGAELLIETLPKYISGKIKPREQDHNQATFTKMFKREDGHINWSESGEKIYNQIKALNPEPGTWTTWKRKVLNIQDGVLSPPHPGRIRSADLHATEIPLSATDFVRPMEPSPNTEVPALGPPLSSSNVVIKVDNQIAVALQKCYLILKTIQLEGGKEMDVKSFLNGHPDFLNSKLE